MINKGLLTAGLLAGILLLCSCKRTTWHKENGIIWTTEYNITYYADHTLSDSVTAALNRVDASLSAFNPNSLISVINQDSLGGPVDIMLTEVLATSLAVNARSGGMFDPTVSPLVNLWGFGFTGHEPKVPTEAQIDSALENVGITKCRLDGFRLWKGSPGMQFNFSAIAKGYASDCVADALQRGGATACMVEIGGEIALRGESPRGGKWRVSIDAPDATTPDAHTSMRVVEVAAPCGIATSGNYRNFHNTREGKVGHTISPVTGRPLQTDVISATVIAPTCVEADALATACMAMDSEKALQMIEQIADVEVLLVVSNSTQTTPQILTTPGFPE